ncbi:MAG: pentapeptide repeat-containing protein [Bacteroidales bacterium]|nr:pentapeptide repeat-containing protein [Bacteroidales bacterium]
MDTKTMQIGDYLWTPGGITGHISNEKLKHRFFSWTEFSTPTSYTKCDGSDMAIRKCTFVSQYFIECDFDRIDASDSTFIDCLFLNCSFKNANFHSATFVGTAIIRDKDLPNKETFKGAGMAQTKFKSSHSNRTILSNLNFEGCGFRHSIFESAVFNKLSIKHASFENAYLKECIIDCLDLKNSACRGIIVENCKVKKYTSSLEKALGGIGILQTLEDCDVFELHFGDFRIDKLSVLWKKLGEIYGNFISAGKLFEFINIINYLWAKEQEKISEKYHLSNSNALQLSIHNNSVRGYPVSREGIFLHQAIDTAYKELNEEGKKINLDDILYSLKAMYFLNIREYVLLKLLFDIYKNESLTRQNDYSDFLIVSQINHYFHIVGNRIVSNVYKITFHNETALWQNENDRNNFYEICKQFMAVAAEKDNDFKLVSMHEGSIDAIFESLFSIDKILIAASILGCRFQVIDGKISFMFAPADGIKSYAELIKELASIIPFLGDKKITNNTFNSILEKIATVISRLREYASKNPVTGDIKQNNATEEIEEDMKTIRFIEMTKDKLTLLETTETQKRITKN